MELHEISTIDTRTHSAQERGCNPFCLCSDITLRPKAVQSGRSAKTFTINCPLAADMLHDYTHLPFEDGKFMCFAGWDEYLRRKYNDYMHLPPEKDRVWKHHPLLIDFEHNYEELRDDES